MATLVDSSLKINQIQLEREDRYEYIDILKGLTIIWVLWMHMDLPELIYPSVQMPIFFFISGTFYHAKKPTLWQQIKSDAYRLLLPVIMFMTIAAILLIIRGDDLWSSNIIDTIQNLRNSSITWFLIALFCFRTLNFLFEYYKIKWLFLVIAAIIYPIGYLWKVKFPEIIVPIIPLQEMFMFGIYYVLGYCFGGKCLKSSSFKQSSLLSPIVLIYIGYIAFVHLMDWESGYLKYIPWFVYGLPYTISCIYLGLLLNRFIEKIPFFTEIMTYVGRNSIVFYLTHWPIWIFLFKPLYWNPYLVFVIISAIEFPLIYIINQYSPWLVGKSLNHHGIRKPR